MFTVQTCKLYVNNPSLLLQGWQRKLDPEYDVMHTLQTMLFKVDWAESLFYTIEGLMAP